MARMRHDGICWKGTRPPLKTDSADVKPPFYVPLPDSIRGRRLGVCVLCHFVFPRAACPWRVASGCNDTHENNQINAEVSTHSMFQIMMRVAESLKSQSQPCMTARWQRWNNRERSFGVGGGLSTVFRYQIRVTGEPKPVWQGA